MIEILWHGRGGQGAFTAARLLGAAASLSEAAHSLAFPSFGPERRGAPMRAFTKISDAPIGDRSAIALADYVIYLDNTLFAPGWEDELKPGGTALVNLGGAPELDGALRPTRDDVSVIGIDADAISSAVLGRPIPNTVFLGALAALGVVGMDDVEQAIEQYMAPKLHDSNKAIVRKAAEAVEAGSAAAFGSGAAATPAATAAVATPAPAAASASGPAGAPATAASADDVADALESDTDPFDTVDVAGPDAAGKAAAIDAAAGMAPGDVDAVVETASPEVPTDAADAFPWDFPATGAPQRSRDAAIPLLRDDERRTCAPAALNPAEYAHNTCFEAGHLVAKNAGWRNIRPVLSPVLCTGCLQCYLYCPDGCVSKTGATKDRLSASDSQGAAVAIDYDFCKGCGICARVCRFNAIAMVPEADALEREAQAAAAPSAGDGEGGDAR